MCLVWVVVEVPCQRVLHFMPLLLAVWQGTGRDSSTMHLFFVGHKSLIHLPRGVNFFRGQGGGIKAGIERYLRIFSVALSYIFSKYKVWTPRWPFGMPLVNSHRSDISGPHTYTGVHIQSCWCLLSRYLYVYIIVHWRRYYSSYITCIRKVQ